MQPEPGTPRGEELLAHGRFLRSLARVLVGDGERADDLVQDTWLAALEHPPRHGAAPRAWLAQILRRLAIKKGLREGERGAREHASAVERSEGAEGEPLALAAEIELSRRVLQCVERLREPYQSTLYLRYYRGLAPQDIAAQQRVPVKTVKTRLARGLELLREDLDRQHGGVREAWVALLMPLARAPLAPGPVSAPPARVAPALPLAAGVLAVAVLGGGLYWLAGGADERAEPRAASLPVVAPTPTTRTVAEPEPARGRSALGGSGATKAAEEPSLARLRGRVSDALGEPLAGAEVVAERLDVERRGSFGAHGRAHGPEARAGELVRGTSDANGEFELALGGSGLARLTVEHDGFAPRARRLLVFVGQDLDLGRIALEAGVFLAGSVRDERGAPVVGAEILEPRLDEGLAFGPREARGATLARTDERGRFALTRVAVGPWRIEVRAPDLAPSQLEGATASAGERVEDLELTLVAGAEVRGHVAGLTPDELGRARVLALPAERDGRMTDAERTVAPDARGEFRVGGLAPGEELELVLLSDEDGAGGRERREARRVRAGESDVELRPERRGLDGPERPPRAAVPSAAEPAALDGSAEVLVRDADGSPAVGALVARRSATGERRFAPVEIRATDKDGRVRWDELAVGRHELCVLSGVFGLQAAAEAWSPLEVRADEPATLALMAAPRATLRGVARSAGEPLARARVLLQPALDEREGRSAMLTTTSDAQGRFELRDLPLGSYRLQLLHDARALPEEREVELVAGGTELAFELDEAWIQGFVRDPAGRALEGVALRVLSDEDSLAGAEPQGRERARVVARSDAGGHFELRGLDPARAVRLELALEGRATLRSASLAPGSFAEFTLEPEALLALTLEGARAPFVMLAARGPHGEERALAVPVGRRTELHGLGAGAWQLRLEARPERGAREARVLGERALELEGGKTTELVWTLP